MTYNLKAARNHIQSLKAIRLRLTATQPDDGSWSWWLDKEIAEIEHEIANEHVKGGVSPWMIGAS